MLGRLFERLEERVEGLRSEHVHFVDHVDFVLSLDRRITNVVAQLAHLFDAVVARAVDLKHIETVAARDFLTAVAYPAGCHGRPVNAVECFSQNARGGCLADSARPDEKIGVGQPILLDRVLERTRDVFLADEIVERLRPVFSRKNLVTHAPNLVPRGWAKTEFRRAQSASSSSERNCSCRCRRADFLIARRSLRPLPSPPAVPSASGYQCRPADAKSGAASRRFSAR